MTIESKRKEEINAKYEKMGIVSEPSENDDATESFAEPTPVSGIEVPPVD